MAPAIPPVGNPVIILAITCVPGAKLIATVDRVMAKLRGPPRFAAAYRGQGRMTGRPGEILG